MDLVPEETEEVVEETIEKSSTSRGKMKQSALRRH
jgi:hypothetical protein